MLENWNWEEVLAVISGTAVFVLGLIIGRKGLRRSGRNIPAEILSTEIDASARSAERAETAVGKSIGTVEESIGKIRDAGEQLRDTADANADVADELEGSAGLSGDAQDLIDGARGDIQKAIDILEKRKKKNND